MTRNFLNIQSEIAYGNKSLTEFCQLFYPRLYKFNQCDFNILIKKNKTFLFTAGEVALMIVTACFTWFFLHIRKNHRVETTLLKGRAEVIRYDNKKQEPVYLHSNKKLIVEHFAANKESSLPNNTQVATSKKSITLLFLIPLLNKKKELKLQRCNRQNSTKTTFTSCLNSTLHSRVAIF